MTLAFKWDGKKPTRPSPETIESGLKAALAHFNDPRGIKAQVATAYIRLDKLEYHVEGVGWSANDAERLVVFNYSLLEGLYSCVDYKS